MSSTLFWVNIVLLVIIIALIIWLLARGSQAGCKEGQKINQSCTQNSDCNTGLVCDQLLGGAVCKVPSGGVCETNTECSTNLTCQNGVCMGKGGGLNDPCPCGEGLTCVNNVCKRKIGGTCVVNADCADGVCKNNVCATSNPAAFSATPATLAVLMNETNNDTCGECGMGNEDCECYQKYDYQQYDRSSDEHKYYYSSSDSRSGRRKHHQKNHHDKSYCSDESYSSESYKKHRKHHNRKHCDTDSRSRYYSVSDSVSDSKPCYTDTYKTSSTSLDSSANSDRSHGVLSSKPSSYTMTSSNVSH